MDQPTRRVITLSADGKYARRLTAMELPDGKIRLSEGGKRIGIRAGFDETAITVSRSELAGLAGMFPVDETP